MVTATPISKSKQYSADIFSTLPSQTMTPPNSSSKNSSQQHKRRFKKLPMIVDISVDVNGNQVYQVHETKKLVRKEMPRSDFPSTIVTQQKHKGLQQLSVNCLNMKREFPSYDDEWAKIPEKRRKIEGEKRLGDVFNGEENATTSDEVIWSPDVEELFLEALRIIPKNGLTKIKISGRTCGRNELISDFIMTKTGKLRSRKQVSSHIQVIKNMKKNNELIDLIKNGPSDPSLFKTFDEIFGKINFQKSIGATGTIADITTSVSTPPTTPNISPNHKRLKLNKLHPISHQSQQHKSDLLNLKPKPGLDLKTHSDDIQSVDFRLYITDFKLKYFNPNEPRKSHVFTTLKKRDFVEAPVKIRENANLTNRFPLLSDLTNGRADLPVLHGMCDLSLPDFKTNDLNGGIYELSSKCFISNLKSSDKKLSCLSIVYSFGRQILQSCDKVDFKTLKDHNNKRDVYLNLQMCPQFWRKFNRMLKVSHDQTFQGFEMEEVVSDDDTIEIDDTKEDEVLNKQKHAIRGLTIKQIVFSSEKYLSKISLNELIKEDIRSILLWEFNKVDSPAEAFTTIRQIFLPDLPIKGPVEQEQLPTPKTASFNTSQSHQSETASCSPSQLDQFPFIPAPPIQPHITNHASLLNTFQQDSVLPTTTSNQIRSFSLDYTSKNMIHPQANERGFDDSGLILQALNPGELYCDDASIVSQPTTLHQQHLLSAIGKDEINSLFKNEYFW